MTRQEEEAHVHATPGSQLIITGHHVGEPDRTGEVLEARGPGGTAPFLVRWDDTGHVSLLFPGSDCVVRELHHATSHATSRPTSDAGTGTGGTPS